MDRPAPQPVPAYRARASHHGVRRRIPAADDLAHLLTHEDVDRARDRWQVARARGRGARNVFSGRFRVLWLLIGPGILVFLGENDAPSMLSYSATGARFGIGFFLPFVVLTFSWASSCRK